ncbi:hypothetical protein [Methanoregula sp.]|uniref:hypothetical protein n=1 Tax=Methanoregula sp. TaxID=2052170 RepID=UPI003C7940CD
MGDVVAFSGIESVVGEVIDGGDRTVSFVSGDFIDGAIPRNKNPEKAPTRHMHRRIPREKRIIVFRFIGDPHSIVPTSYRHALFPG